MSDAELSEIEGETRTGRQRESERKRRRILETARDCFGRLGFARATIETISAEAAVSAAGADLGVDAPGPTHGVDLILRLDDDGHPV